MTKLFFRVEHATEHNQYLVNYSNNCPQNKKIGCGPWSFIERYSNDETLVIYELTKNHALPYPPKEGQSYPFDNEIYEIVKCEQYLVKENFIFGCKERYLVNRYFHLQYRKILNSHGFVLNIYSSDYIYHSKHQSVMDISKSYNFIGTTSLV